MGQKVNPVSYRLQVNKNWSSKWFARKADFKNWLIEDVKIRETIENRFKSRPTIDRIGIERSPNLTVITIRTAKAGAVIGKQGAGINELKKELEKVTNTPLRINVEEVKKPKDDLPINNGTKEPEPIKVSRLTSIKDLLKK